VAAVYGVEGLRMRMDEGEMRRGEGAGSRWGRRRKEAEQASPFERALSS
jgi:hypothetical protein